MPNPFDSDFDSDSVQLTWLLQPFPLCACEGHVEAALARRCSFAHLRSALDRAVVSCGHRLVGEWDWPGEGCIGSGGRCMETRRCFWMGNCEPTDTCCGC